MDEKIKTTDYIFKIVVLGDAGVGKSALTIRFATNSFIDNYTVTLGMNLVTKHVTLTGSDGSEIAVEYAVWDIGGQPNFKTILPMYYQGAFGALVVYDLTKKKSFENIEFWMKDIKKHCGEVPLIIIGNKSDLISERAITIEEGLEFTKKVKETWSEEILFIETSAKENIGVTEAYMDLANNILKIVEKEEAELEN